MPKKNLIILEFCTPMNIKNETNTDKNLRTYLVYTHFLRNGYVYWFMNENLTTDNYNKQINLIGLLRPVSVLGSYFDEY